jgi:glycine/D-amino acid oxidase-like deaminating enzyme
MSAVWGQRRSLSPPQPLPARAEVVIVGGGITGVAVLGALRSRDVDAILLERDEVAAGASGRNAGFLLAGVAENYARAVARYGRSTAAEVWRFTLENHALVAALATGLDAGHHVRGSLTVALDAAESASLEEAATLLREDGLPGVITAADQPPGAMAALHNPADGEIDPVRLVGGLAAALAGRVHENRRVVAVDDGAEGAVVHLDRSSIEAAAVVLATNAWTAELLASVPITAVRAQMLATAPVPPCIPRPVYAEWGHRYWRQRDDGIVLVGGFRHRALGDEVGFDVTPTPVVQAHLDEQLATLAGGARVTHRWAGTMGFSPDGLALVGLVDGARHVHVCAGYTGHGMGFAVNAAAVLVRQILDSNPVPAWLDAQRFGSGLNLTTTTP